MANITKIKLPSGDTYDIVDEKSGYITSASLPTKTSDLENDGDGSSAFATMDDIGQLGGGTITAVKTTAGAHTTIDVSSGNASFNVPTKTSHLTNDSGFVTTDENVLQTVDNTSNGMLSMVFAGHNTETSGVYKSSKITFTPNDSRLKVSASTVGQGESIYMAPDGIGFNDGSHGTAVVRLPGNYSQTSGQTFYLPNTDGGTFALTSDINVSDVYVNNASVIDTNGIAQITSSAGDLTLNGTLSADTLSLNKNHALYLDGSTSSSKVISADYQGANNVYWYTPGYYVFRTDWNGTNYKRVLNLSSSEATFDVPITASNHNSRIGASGPDFSKGSYTQKTTSSVNTLGTITLPAGDWILKGWIQFPGGTAGYRRVWVTSSSGTTATGTTTLNQSYAAGSTICTVQCVLLTHTTASTTYYLRGASNVELTISYCDMDAIRIA